MDYRKVFKKYPCIITAYLFGSRARGDFSLISDYDFAVQVSDKIKSKEYIDLKLSLIKDLSRLLKTDELDVVVLNEAPILLKHRVLRDRKVLFCRSQLARIRNEAKILIEYLDEKEYEQAFARGIFQHILEAA